MYVLEDVELLFLGDKKGWTEPFKEMSIIVPPREVRKRKYTEGISSLLGFDFLCRCKISIDRKKGEIYLDLEE